MACESVGKPSIFLQLGRRHFFRHMAHPQRWRRSYKACRDWLSCRGAAFFPGVTPDCTGMRAAWWVHSILYRLSVREALHEVAYQIARALTAACPSGSPSNPPRLDLEVIESDHLTAGKRQGRDRLASRPVQVDKEGFYMGSLHRRVH